MSNSSLSLSRLHLGASGWSYPAWKGIFYPPGLKAGDYLSYYAENFNAVELNSSFYRTPRPQTVARWAAVAPPPFGFALKLYRGITHYQKLQNSAESLSTYFTAMVPMAGRGSVVLAQLPASLSFDAHTVETFCQALKPYQSEFNFALEGRHTSWFSDEALELLDTYGIAFVTNDAGEYFPGLMAQTGPLAYLRFHGRAELYKTAYTETELMPYAEWAAALLTEGLSVWAFFNNTWYGHALENARTLRRLVESYLR